MDQPPSEAQLPDGTGRLVGEPGGPHGGVRFQPVAGRLPGIRRRRRQVLHENPGVQGVVGDCRGYVASELV